MLRHSRGEPSDGSTTPYIPGLFVTSYVKPNPSAGGACRKQTISVVNNFHKAVSIGCRSTVMTTATPTKYTSVTTGSMTPRSKKVWTADIDCPSHDKTAHAGSLTETSGGHIELVLKGRALSQFTSGEYAMKTLHVTW